MSSLIEKVKDKLHAHSDTKSEQPEGTHGPHSSRTANAADPRVDSDRDNREALGRHDGSYTTGGDNYSYGSSNTKGMNTAGDTLASSAKTGPAPTTAGVHKSDMMNKADPRIDSDLDGSRNMGLRSEQATHAGTTSTTHGTGTTSTTHGTGTTSTAYGTGTTGTGTTGTTFGSTGPASKTAGTHKSDTMNKADPRIDSDLDGSRNMGLRSEKATHDLGATGSTHTTGTTSTGNTFGTTGTTSTTAGTHKSDTLNKADPRIDSDLDGSRNMGLRSEKATHDLGTTRTAGTSGATTGTGFGTGMGTDTLGAGRGVDTSGTTGTYTGLSGQDRTSGLGSGTDTYSTGTSGTGRTSGLGSGTDTYSTGTSGMGRATGTGGESTARIGSISTDAYGQPAQHTTKLPGDIGSDDVTPATKHHGAGTHSTGHHGTGHHGAGNLGGGDTTTTSAYGGMGSLGGGFGTDRQATGPAPNTAGPHQSDMMNKADPRVDSDLDNSKTFGGDKTYQSDAGITAKDPTDAAQVPPSVMQKHIGEPTIEHGDRNYDRVRRHSVSHQEQHRGL